MANDAAAREADTASGVGASGQVPPGAGAAAGIRLTDAAARHVRRYLEGRGKGIGLRLGVRTTGCSGLAYTLEFADEVAANDEVFEDHDIKVIVDRKSLVYLAGTELDFTKSGLNEGFLFRNPNVKDECGCGESFTI